MEDNLKDLIKKLDNISLTTDERFLILTDIVTFLAKNSKEKRKEIEPVE